LTAWLAVAAYASASAGLLLRRGRDLGGPGWPRVVWTLGCLVFLAHVACAFGFVHGWSHADAYRATAGQTAEMTGVNWGGGIYLNYLFAALWSADTAWWWAAPAHHEHRPRAVAAGLHAFLFFMVVNGAFVFVRGPLRWLGLVLCLAVAGLWVGARSGNARASTG
jgi:hypothetical protein